MATPLRRSTRSRTIASMNACSILPTTAVSSSTVLAVNGASVSTTTRPRKRAKLEVEVEEHINLEVPARSNSKTKVGKLPKGKCAGALNPEQFPERTQTDWKVGAHVSAAGGVENAILNAASIGANAFALFVKSQRKWTSTSLTRQSIETFKSRLQEFKYPPDLVLPHGSYLINLGNPDADKRQKSYDCFLDDLRRCELLGLTRYNFHPGSTVGAATKEESIAHIAACLNRAHKETSTVVTVIENMAGSGNVVGSKFEEIARIIDQVDDKSRVGVCLDTCHMFAAGYDIRSKEAYEISLSEFDRIVGLRYLRGMHLNDSKVPLASRKDRHENIGRGQISLATFGYILQDPRLQHIPLILETPTNEHNTVWAKEIEVLNELSTILVADGNTLRILADAVGGVVAKAAKDTGKLKRQDGATKTKQGSNINQVKGIGGGRGHYHDEENAEDQ